MIGLFVSLVTFAAVLLMGYSVERAFLDGTKVLFWWQAVVIAVMVCLYAIGNYAYALRTVEKFPDVQEETMLLKLARHTWILPHLVVGLIFLGGRFLLMSSGSTDMGFSEFNLDYIAFGSIALAINAVADIRSYIELNDFLTSEA